MIRINRNVCKTNWTGEANWSTGYSDHHGFRSKLKLSGADEACQLDIVDRMVAPDQNDNRLTIGRVD